MPFQSLFERYFRCYLNFVSEFLSALFEVIKHRCRDFRATFRSLLGTIFRGYLISVLVGVRSRGKSRGKSDNQRKLRERFRLTIIIIYFGHVQYYYSIMC